jgi:hypothetical protein
LLASQFPFFPISSLHEDIHDGVPILIPMWGRTVFEKQGTNLHLTYLGTQ